jgi:hypothetical protein
VKFLVLSNRYFKFSILYTVIYFETSENFPVPAQPKLRYEFLKFLSTPKLGTWKLRSKFMTRSFGCWFRIESMKKLILVSARLVELWNFVLLFWAVGLEPRIFGLKVDHSDQWTKQPTDMREKISNLNDASWHVMYWTIPEKFRWKKTKFRIKFIIFSNNETSGFLRLSRKFRGFQPKLPLNNWKFRLIFQNGMHG